MMYSRFRAFGIYHDLLFASLFFQQELGLNQLNNSGFFLDQKPELNQQKCWCELGICPSAIGAMWHMKIMKTEMERILSISISFIYSSWYQDFFSHKLNVQTPDEVFNPNSMLDFNRLDPGVKLWMQFCQDCWLYFFAAFWGFAFELSIRTFWLHGSPFLIYVLRFFFPITVNCQVQVLNWFSHDSDSSWPVSLYAHQTTSPCFSGMRCLHMKKD